MARGILSITFILALCLKALAKIEQLTGCPGCRSAIERGISYYVKNLVDADGLPLPFSKAPRLTVYRRELYDFAECINLAVLLQGRFPELDTILSNVLTELLGRWHKTDGSFRARQLLVGWDNVPMHRWAQAQIFRSLCFFLSRNLRQPQEMITRALFNRWKRLQSKRRCMCGICGQYNYGSLEPVRRRDIEAMTNTLVHRGPDDEGYYLAGPLGFGFRRLSIIDLAGGHQPMSDQEAIRLGGVQWRNL